MQNKMNNHQDCAQYPKDNMEAIWHSYKVNFVAKMEYPRNHTESISCDKGKPHNAVNKAISPNIFGYFIEMASTQGFEPTPMPENVPGNASQPHHPKKDMGSYPFAAGKPEKNTFYLVGDGEPKQEPSNDRYEKNHKEGHIEPEITFCSLHSYFLFFKSVRFPDLLIPAYPTFTKKAIGQMQ
jgi:hypothetical protein